MFQTLAEGFQTSGGDPHTDYIMSQNKYFGSLPNMIPAATSGLKGFGDAIQNVDNDAKNYLSPAVPYPDSIFRNPHSDNLTSQAGMCAMASIDDLIRTQDPTAKSGCGWIYTPPRNGSPYPILSRGALGADRGPAPGFGTPAYQKWFFDLQEAKKTILMDKCKALKSCTAVSGDPYSGTCGFCQDNNQGIPIDSNGEPLYPGDSRGNCASDIILDRAQCPSPPSTGIQPVTDRTCDIINGRMSAMCLYNQVIAGGCSNNGTLAQALRAPKRMDDYLSEIRDSDAMKMYQRTANPVVNFDLFKMGQTTVDAALREVRLLSSQATQPSNTAVGSSARDLCLNRGAISGYDPCIELSDGSPAPFNRQCLQQLFLKMGGQPVGKLYPSDNTEAIYNQQGNWGGVKRFLQGKIQQMQRGNDGFADYNTQRTALSEMLGITPEASIKRAPYKQGVEVFWFAPPQWNGGFKVLGAFLKRTVERDFKQYYGPSSFPGVGNCVGWLQMTDIRAKSDASMKFRVCVDDGFYLTINQPNDYDGKALTQGAVDKPGHFANMNWQGPTWYQSNTCIPINASTPNITKAYFVDGGGWASFVIQPQACAGVSPFTPVQYSLTCEERAPFLAFEGIGDQGWFGELRNPSIFGQMLEGRGWNMTRPGEQTDAPGRKPYIRMNSDSICNFFNICYQSWKTVSFTMRFRSMPVKESIINLAFERIGGLYFNLVAIPMNGSQFTIQIEHNLGWRSQVTTTSFVYTLGIWYIFYINNRGTGFDVYSADVDSVIRGGSIRSISVDHSGMMWAQNGSWNPSPGQPQQACNVMVGSNGYVNRWAAMYATGAFQYDLATVHFFDRFINRDDAIRECKSNWIYTDFPKEYNKYA
jgi:hypothetical protein